MNAYVNTQLNNQTLAVTGANASIVTANTAMKSYVDGLNTAMIGNVAGANAAIVTANSAVVSYVNTLNTAMASNVAGANASIVTANTAMKSYVDAQVVASGGYGNTQVQGLLPNYNGNILAGNISITSSIYWTGNGQPYSSGGGFNGATTIVISNTTPTTSNVTGALVVAGGVGITGNLYIGGAGALGFSSNANVSVAYQVYNPTYNSIDTIFG
jgi:hypothetical protein